MVDNKCSLRQLSNLNNSVLWHDSITEVYRKVKLISYNAKTAVKKYFTHLIVKMFSLWGGCERGIGTFQWCMTIITEL